MATRQDVDRIYEEFNHDACLSIELWLGSMALSFYLDVLRRPELLTINHIGFLKDIAKKFKLEHLTSHIHEDFLVGVEGTDISDYTEEALSVLPRISSDDVQKIAANILGTLDFLGYAFTLLWEEENADFVENNPNVDAFELSEALFEHYMDRVSYDCIYDEETNSIYRFNFKEFTIFDYVNHKRFNHDMSEFSSIHKNYMLCVEEELEEGIFKDFDEEIFKIEELMRESVMCVQLGDTSGIENISRKIDFILDEAIYDFYLRQDDLWKKFDLD